MADLVQKPAPRRKRQFGQDTGFESSDSSSSNNDDDVGDPSYSPWHNPLDSTDEDTSSSDSESGDSGSGDPVVSPPGSLAPTAAADTSDIPSWSTAASPMPVFPFTGQPGLQFDASALQEPIDFFKLYCNDDFFTLLAQETNRYAGQIGAIRPQRKHARMQKWCDVTAEELQRFLGLCLHMGDVKLPSVQHYWKHDPLYRMEVWGATLSVKRFLNILRCLHFVDNDSDSGADRLWKLRPILDHFNSQNRNLYYPPKELSLDECMVLWRGRLSFRQYITGKRHKYGVKIYEVCTPDGFVCNAYIYSGQSDPTSGTGHTEKVVLGLLDGVLGNGHSVYMDSYYNSVRLAVSLANHNTYCTGTLRKERKDNPKDVIGQTLSKGEHIFRQNGPVVVSKWHDKRDVLLISTEHPHQMVDAQNRRGQVQQKPLAVREYNRFMSGIDRSDMMTSYYSCLRKGLKWYRKMFFHFLDVMLWNAFMLHRLAHPNARGSLLDFRSAVVRSLIGASQPPKHGKWERRAPSAELPNDPVSNVVQVLATAHHLPLTFLQAKRKRTPHDGAVFAREKTYGKKPGFTVGVVLVVQHFAGTPAGRFIMVIQFETDQKYK